MSPPAGLVALAIGALTKPGLRALDRAQRVMTNQSRAMWYDAALASVNPSGKVTPSEARSIGRAVMVASGRGSMGKLDNAIPLMNMVLNATRFYISRIQALTLQPLWMADKGTRTEVAKMYGRSVAGRAVMYTILAAILGKRDDDDEKKDGIVLNPLSTDFGRIRHGKVSADFTSGMNSFATIVARLVTGEKIDSKGKVVKLTSEQRNNINDEAMRFLKSKRNLNTAFLWDTFIAKSYFGGKEVTPATMLEEATNMIILNDTKRIFEELGPVKGAAVWTMMFTGAGTSIRDEKKKTAVDAYGNPTP